MAKNTEITLLNFSGFFGLVLYLGIGALCHAVFVGATFDWLSAWTWGWLLGWPIMLFAAFWVVILGLAVVGIVAAIAIAILESDAVSRWRTNRAIKRAREKINAARGKHT